MLHSKFMIERTGASTVEHGTPLSALHKVRSVVGVGNKPLEASMQMWWVQ